MTINKCNCIPCLKNTIKDEKIPTSKISHIGVEIEFISTLNEDDLMDVLLKANLGKYIQLKDDGSIRTNRYFPYSYELAVLCNYKNFSNILKKVCKVISPYSRVNKSCGLHVHLDMRYNNNFKRIYHNLYIAQPLFYAIQPSSRYTNNYCIPITNNIFPARYANRAGINGASYYSHKTIEIRLHAGTINPIKIINWINILHAVAKKRSFVKKQTRTLNEFVKEFTLTHKLETYIKERLVAFSNDNNI